MIEYELIQQRGRELQARAAHQRLVDEARTAARPAGARRRPVRAALATLFGRLTGGAGGEGAEQRASRPVEC